MSDSECCVTDKPPKWIFLFDNPLRGLLTRPKKFVSQHLSKGAVAVDLGCGPGFFTIPMAEVVAPEGKVFGVDSDKRSIEVLRLKASNHGYENVEARVASASHAEFVSDHSVDFVFANLMLCCTLDHKGVIREIKRMLKPTGSAYLSVTRRLKKDPRDVNAREWQTILSEFNVIKKWNGIFTRRAVVFPKLID